MQLPQIVSGNYWLSDKTGANERKLINIEARNGKWQIVSNSYAQIINPACIKISNDNIEILNKPDRTLNKIILQGFGMYGITLENTDEIYILYCSPAYEENIVRLDIIDSDEIIIGRGKDSDIICANKLLAQAHAKLSKENGFWGIENFDRKFGTFVNNFPVLSKKKILYNGDVIFIMGLRVILIGDSIYINNPLNNVSFNPQKFAVHEDNINITTENIKEDDNTEIYTEKDYFFRSPRITNKIEKEKVRIDTPPQIQDKEEMPLILTLGTSLTMGLMMVLSMSSAISAQANGTAQLKDTIVSVLISVLMLVGMLLFPVLTVKYERKRKENYEKKRQERYKKYIDKKANTIEQIMEKQRNILLENYVSLSECCNIIVNKTGRLWERKIEDHDFLTVRLGTGDLPLDIDVQYTEERICNAR